MTATLKKLGFIHRRLWGRDELYRLAVLLGPASLLGCLLAAILWEGIAVVGAMNNHPLPWAVPEGPRLWSASDGQSHTVQPSSALPSMRPDGTLAGYEPGWRATINPIEVGAASQVDVKTTVLVVFPFDGSSIDMERLLIAGPKNSQFVGEGQAFFVVKTPGIYTLSARLERPAAPQADCLVRLAFGPQRVISNLKLAISTELSITYDPISFDLQPGLYSTAWAFGCWHDHLMTTPGRLTVLVGHPGEDALLPARLNDFVRLGAAP